MVKIDSDGDVAVAFGNQAWVFNPGLLTPVKGGNVDVLDDGEGDNDSDQEEDDDSSGDLFIHYQYPCRITQFSMLSYHVCSFNNWQVHKTRVKECR